MDSIVSNLVKNSFGQTIEFIIATVLRIFLQQNYINIISIIVVFISVYIVVYIIKPILICPFLLSNNFRSPPGFCGEIASLSADSISIMNVLVGAPWNDLEPYSTNRCIIAELIFGVICCKFIITIQRCISVLSKYLYVYVIVIYYLQ